MSSNGIRTNCPRGRAMPSELVSSGASARSTDATAAASAGGCKSVGKQNPLTYPKSEKPFSDALFRTPTAEYRGCPFWAWNNKLNREQLKHQIDVFEAMGLGGFHMHSRVGLDTEYLGNEFLDHVKFCVDYAESKGMLACLYDEDKWPSGIAGGKLIERYPEHLVKHILFTPNFNQDTPQRYLLARYSIVLDESGCLASSRMLRPDEQVDDDGDLWYAYVEELNVWGNIYVDTLSERAIARFIEMTHETYKAKVGDRFGTTIPCIFTDEPQFSLKTRLPEPWSKNDVLLPWSPDLAHTFAVAYGRQADIVRDLPQLIWDLPARKASLVRWRYHDHVCERFVTAFMDQLAAWCANNNLMLDGHMMMEDSLSTQTMAIGEAMRCYRNQQIPGMDLLFDSRELNTAKQVASVARQKGARGAMSELYGVTHWTFTFEGHKGCGDWHAALGITFRVQHLAWVSMAGEGKRDYPASIGYQSPWCLEYGHIEDHFARVNVAMTRGRAVTRVAVVHPLESYWLALGPERPSQEGEWRDQAFRDLTDWLLYGLVDFDFISESLLPGQFGGTDDQTLLVGECAYEVVILPNLRTVRGTTMSILRQFAKAGGKIIVAGQHPELIDAQEPDSFPTISHSRSLKWDRDVILAALDQYRDLRVISPDGVSPKEPESLLYQLRADGVDRYLFACNTDRSSPFDGEVQLRGLWDVTILDTFTGEQRPQPAAKASGWTSFQYRFEGCASLLLRLSPAKSAFPLLTPSVKSCFAYGCTTESLALLAGVDFSEPNVLMLDQPVYKLGDQDWQGPLEILHIEDEIREQLGLPQKISMKQPWTIPLGDRQPAATLSLLFTFEVVGAVDSTFLAVELQDGMDIQVNGEKVDIAACSNQWWVDMEISKILLPGVRQGTNRISIQLPFGILTNIERLYLLGDFRVELNGDRAIVRGGEMPPVSWGDITRAGFPFYAGNVIYSFVVPVQTRSRVVLHVPDFSSPVLAVHHFRHGAWQRLGRIAFEPHQLDLGILDEGIHTYRVTAFGDLYNAFGHIHITDDSQGCGPDLWRRKDSTWTNEYKVRPIGLLTAPKLLATEVEESLLESDPDPTEKEAVSSQEFTNSRHRSSSISTPLGSPGWFLVGSGDTEGF